MEAAVEKKQELMQMDDGELRITALQINEAVQAVQYVVTEIENSIIEVKNENNSFMTRLFIDGELTEYVNMLKIFARDLERNSKFLMDNTET